MATYAQIARAHLGNLGKVSLGFYPTPFHKLESISSAYDVNLWIKREDFSGSTLFGGNKIRKLEYLLHDAKKQGCDTVFTYPKSRSKPSRYSSENDVLIEKSVKYTDFFLLSIVYV